MLYYGVIPLYSNRADTSDAIVGDALVQLRDNKLLKIGVTVVVAYGRFVHDGLDIRKPHTNAMRVEVIY